MRDSHAEALGTADDPEYGEVTGAFIRAAQVEHKATADALLNGEPAGPHYLAVANRQALADAHGRGHARTRAPRLRFPWARRGDPAPVSQLLAPAAAPSGISPSTPEAPEDGELRADEPGDFTQAISRYQSEALPPEAFTRPATGELREDEAAERVVAERAELPRMYAPAAISAIPLGVWDTPANREPMRYVPDLPADLTDLPDFREAVRRCTRSGPVSASACEAEKVDGQTWGERMVRRAMHLLAPPEIAAFTFGAADLIAEAEAPGTEPDPGTPEPPGAGTPDPAAQADGPEAAEACIEAYDALHPVPAAPGQAGAADVTA